MFRRMLAALVFVEALIVAPKAASLPIPLGLATYGFLYQDPSTIDFLADDFPSGGVAVLDENVLNSTWQGTTSLLATSTPLLHVQGELDTVGAVVQSSVNIGVQAFLSYTASVAKWGFCHSALR